MSQNRSEPNSTATVHPEDWRTLAEKASNEMDPKKLLDLVQRLCEELNKHRSEKRLPNSLSE